MPDASEEVARLARWLAQTDAVTVLTGAGISTDSGIPDYRGPNGVWTRNPDAMRTVTFADYVADPEVRRRAWQHRREHGVWTATPNAAHRALATLERAGTLRALLTQNIDGLHQRAGSTPELVVELHGTIHAVQCLDCSTRTAMVDELERVTDVVPDPSCRACGGMLKSATISFGQSLDRAVLQRAIAAARDCELFLAVGTSLQVQPVAGLCQLAADAGARLVIVNASPTPYDELAIRSGGGLIREPIGSVLPAVVGEALAV
ncbi:MAG: Sir2 family NAD-dependent protein deacetylase [Frankiaceae bacterium]